MDNWTLKRGIVGSGLRRVGRCLYHVNHNNRFRPACNNNAEMRDGVRMPYCAHHHVEGVTRKQVEQNITSWDDSYARLVVERNGTIVNLQLTHSICATFTTLNAKQTLTQHEQKIVDRINAWLDEANNIDSLINQGPEDVNDDDIIDVWSSSDDDSVILFDEY